ncbi:hypothetical protein M407DRAFT_244334 [Tulasnella calospora MUT 4182]|uniref:Uncharacterized protein n=1 Tax=Tulasnella calospora MUT 4182 TaxID=1051891 RepID=A0A0C3KTC1_9AGAM|nr:hypothetical protein M407DRAFT_244334 [Tulasnella calospora MUT 4182]
MTTWDVQTTLVFTKRRLLASSRSAETRVERRSQTPTCDRGIEGLFTAPDHQLMASSTLICFIRVCNSEI